ncbi:hypothetical protein [Nostoc sp. ChiQUE01b]|uniref:hypothetical protein n=1 Tax=Nostoc sp. ChiQUE01b TaxID=3075376 RepID=UPI002AD36C25|nr:hypothetical protein [Nostoc sp. ChiQUE01b]MDZ8260890.1 hypothetical protein [Nostoc sp. ChiQUE01b]
MNQNDTSQSIPILISIIPNLMEGEGHIIPYHASVTKAANLLAWKHVVAVASESKIADLPTNWQACLSSENLELTMNPIIRIFKYNDIYKLGFSIAKYLKKEILPNSKHNIIFIERFIHVQLLGLLIALCIIPKENLSVWLLYRRDTHKDKTRSIYKLLNKLIKGILESGKFHVLTDSESLSKSLSNYFNEPVTVMPIPHTDFIDVETIPELTNEVICWWPGAPRTEKGWNIIKSLMVCVSEEAKKICVVAAESSELSPLFNGVKVELIPHRLSKSDYLKWLKTSNIILLPYDADAYSERTSGIFTECIMAGKIPVVTKGTWMARELAKYGMEELIIEWSQPDLIVSKIINLSKSLTVKNKIKEIQKAYQNFHTVESYAHQMQILFEQGAGNRE